jgi:hypothetical protein
VYPVVLANLFVYVQEVHDDAVQNGTLAHAVDTAQDIDIRLQLPTYVLTSVPKSIYLNALDILSVHGLTMN